jgi:hypothetical protein
MLTFVSIQQVAYVLKVYKFGSITQLNMSKQKTASGRENFLTSGQHLIDAICHW